MKFVNYWWKVQSNENYRDVMLKSFQPFIESAAVLVFVFKPYRQWEACHKKGEEELEHNAPGK
jgi:hypothetical protein